MTGGRRRKNKEMEYLGQNSALGGPWLLNAAGAMQIGHGSEAQSWVCGSLSHPVLYSTSRMYSKMCEYMGTRKEDQHVLDKNLVRHCGR